MQRIEFRESAQDPMAIPTNLVYLGHFSQKLEVEDRDFQQQKNNTQKCDVQAYGLKTDLHFCLFSPALKVLRNGLLLVHTLHMSKPVM